jgi:hypothetical protein
MTPAAPIRCFGAAEILPAAGPQARSAHLSRARAARGSVESNDRAEEAVIIQAAVHLGRGSHRRHPEESVFSAEARL